MRHERGYTGEELAGRCIEFGRGFEPPLESNLSFSIISKIEKGYRTVGLTELVLFAGALAVTREALMGFAAGAISEASDPTLEDRVVELEQKVARILGE